MDDIIRLLPESVSGRIAAGEVVQRPASVVKELVENSIDAGAKSVKVILTDAGRTAIQIIDDGCGMSKSDAVKAFQRHATSKIREPEDLFALNTFGFRGEALASIAAVAEVSLRTRRAEDEVGTEIEISGGTIIRQEPVACPAGCNFTVKNIFYNIPARRKFLKSNQTELSNIIKEIERVALAHPELSISVSHQGAELLSLPESTLKQRIIGLFGKNINKALLPVSTETSAVTVSGFVGTLDSVRRKGMEQFFFVNGRFMRHPYFHKAVIEPYEGLVPDGEQPYYFIFLDVPADSIDVNIHPAKTEIKFSEEQLVWKILNAAVREAVGRYEGTPSINFDTEGMPDIPIAVENVEQVRQPKVSYNPSFNPFHNVSSKPAGSGNGNWSKLYGDVLNEKVRERSFEYGLSAQADERPDVVTLPDSAEKPDRPCFQYNGSYIVSASDNGILVIDQRRAHLCVLYDSYMRQIQQGGRVSQGLLFPEMIQLSPSDAVLLNEYGPDLTALGFDLSDMGRGAVAIQGVPSGLDGVDYAKLLTDMLHTAAEGTSAQDGRHREKMALSMARSASVVAGQILSDAEMRDLLSRYESCGMPRRTPDGKAVCLVIDQKELDSRL